MIVSLIGTVWFTSLSSTCVSYCWSQSFYICALCLPLMCPHLCCSRQGDHCSIQKMGSPSLQLLGSGIANLLQMPPMYVSFVHDDVHLCLGLSLLIPRIPESYELSLDQIPSSNEKQKGSLSGPQHHHLPSLKHCSVCGPYQ